MPVYSLVVRRMEVAGASRADATARVQSLAGLTLSPLADYVADTSTAARSTATLASIVLQVQLKQAAALAPDVVGKTDFSGATATSTDLENALRQAALQQLPTLAAAANDASIANAPDAASRMAAIAAVAQGVASALLPAADDVRQSIGLLKLAADTTPQTPTTDVSLRQFQYADIDHWFYRAVERSAADDTPDANGRHRYYDVRSQATVDVFGLRHVDSWASGGTFERRGDLHWNGSAWVGCELGQRSWNTGRDAHGRTEYDYCDAFEHGPAGGAPSCGVGLSEILIFVNPNDTRSDRTRLFWPTPSDADQGSPWTAPARSTPNQLKAAGENLVDDLMKQKILRLLDAHRIMSPTVSRRGR